MNFEHAISKVPPRIVSAKDAVYDELHLRIMDGLPPGTPLRLDALAKELGVSTMPVRLALNRLQFEDLVVVEPRRGAVVADVNLRDLIDIQLLRAALMSMGVRLGMPRLTSQDDATLKEALSDLRRTTEISDPTERLEAHLTHSRKMQDVVFIAAQHPRIMQLIETNRRASERYIRLALRSLGGFESDMSSDVAFVDAVLARDEPRAERVLRGTLLWTIERAEALFGAEALPEHERAQFEFGGQE